MTDPGQISAPCADSRTLKDCRSCSPTTRAAISVGLPSMMIFTLSPPFAPHAESCPLAAGTRRRFFLRYALFLDDPPKIRSSVVQPNSSAASFTSGTDGIFKPASIRLMMLWLTHSFSASCFWSRPMASRRALNSHPIIFFTPICPQLLTEPTDLV